MLSAKAVTRLLIGMVAATSFVAAAVAWQQSESEFFTFRTEHWSILSHAGRIAALAAAMLAGSFASAVWESIPYATVPGVPPRVDARRVIRLGLESPAFLKAVVVSPITFAVAYSASGTHEDSIIAFLAAFENGFFWNVILQRRRQERDQDD